MSETLTFDVVIVGSGLAGLRAAIEAARVSDGKSSIAVITKVQAMRSHSVSAEGGTAAVLYPDKGDTFESHIYDTIKGSDFLADQDAVDFFVRAMPAEIYQLEHWGMPWSRTEDGRIAQRNFGGYSFPRATFAADRVGFFEMQTLYDTTRKFDNIQFFQEWFVTSLIVDHGTFRGLTTIDMKTGDFHPFNAKAGIIATGGAGRLYKIRHIRLLINTGWAILSLPCWCTDNGHGVRAIPSHRTNPIRHSDHRRCTRRRSGLDQQGWREVHEEVRTQKLDLASRDVVSRAIMTEILEGRGLKDSASGMDYVLLDLRHLGAEKINERLSGIREIALKFKGIDPINEPLPIRPVCHYMMGGVKTNVSAETPIAGLWASGEAACVSINGANRLGANSTAECLVFGAQSGAGAAKYALTQTNRSLDMQSVARDEKRIFDEILHGSGSENPYEIRDQAQTIMDKYARLPNWNRP